MSVTIKAMAQEPYRQIINADNHAFFADVKPDKGGQDTAPDPHQLLFGAWGACTNMTVQMYAQRKGWPLQDVVTTLSESKSNGQPIIEKHIQVRGNLTPEQLELLKRVAERCPVNQLIIGRKTVQSRLELLN